MLAARQERSVVSSQHVANPLGQCTAPLIDDPAGRAGGGAGPAAGRRSEWGAWSSGDDPRCEKSPRLTVATLVSK